MINLGNVSIDKLYVGTIEVGKVMSGNTQIWPAEQPVVETNYVKFSSVSPSDHSVYVPNNIKIDMTSIISAGHESHPLIEYSLDEGFTWTMCTSEENIRFEESILLRGLGNAALAYSDSATSISFENAYASEYGDAVIICEGELVHLLNKNLDPETCEVGEYAFTGLFSAMDKTGCNNLYNTPSMTCVSVGTHAFENLYRQQTRLVETVEILPAMTVGDSAYKLMFAETGLISMPELSAENLADSCYYQMFWHATSLVDTVGLEATTLAPYCYSGMFNGCTSLEAAVDVNPDAVLQPYCFEKMYYGCTGLTDVPWLPWTTLASNCYNAMFNSCTGLEYVDEYMLPAETLADSCYCAMFYKCTSLKNIPNLESTALDSSCYYNMFAYCSSLEDLSDKTLPATNVPQAAYYQMFNQCTGLRKTPILGNLEGQYMTIGSYAMRYMFRNTPLLGEVTAIWPKSPYYATSNSTNNWLQYSNSEGTFKIREGARWNSGVSGIPAGWTTETYSA